MEFQPGLTVGIDLGTTFSSLAYLDRDGAPVAVPNDDGHTSTPSLIVLAESGHVVVGPNRMRAAMEDPANVIERIKREMGNAQFRRTFDGREITPEFASALILKKLKQDAQRHLNQPIGNAVITVPYYFNDARRKATADAGRIAGLNVIDIINEPTAAMLACAWQRGELGTRRSTDDRPRRYLVFDLGGGTFDVTVVECTSTRFRVLATDGDVLLGGLDFNERLVNHVADAFQQRHGIDPRESPLMLQVLRNDCDTAKIALSERPEAAVACRYKGKMLSVSVSRQQFEAMTADLVQRTLDTSELVLQQSGTRPEQLEAMVLVGGSTLMPRIRTALREQFGVELYGDLSPHLAVAHGAAIHAAILEAKFRGADSLLAEAVRRHLAGVQQEHVNSHGLGIAVLHPATGKIVNHVMIPRNTRLPAEVRQVFETRFANQRSVHVRVIEGDAPDPNACAMIGSCVVSELPDGLPQGAPIEVCYRFDASGRVHVQARDCASGRAAAVEIQRRSGLSDSQLEAYTRLARDYLVE